MDSMAALCPPKPYSKKRARLQPGGVFGFSGFPTSAAPGAHLMVFILGPVFGSLLGSILGPILGPISGCLASLGGPWAVHARITSRTDSKPNGFRWLRLSLRTFHQPLGAILGPSWRIWTLSWAILGAMLGDLGAILGPSWGNYLLLLVIAIYI